MKYQEFEKGLSKKFQDASEHVDTKALLLNLDMGKQKKERKLIFWLFFAACTFALAYAATSYISTPESEAHTLSTTISHQENDAKAALLPEKKSEAGSINKTEEKVNTKSKEIQASHEVKNRYQAEKKESKQDHIDPQNNITTKPWETGVVAQEIQTKESSPSQNIIKQDLHAENQVEDVLADPEVKNKKSFASLQLLPLSAKYLDFEEALNPDFVVCPSFKKPRWALDIIPEIGMIKPFKRLSNNSAELNPIFDLRSNDENTLEAIQAGLYLRARSIQKPIYFKLGVSYTRISERMKLNTSWIERDTTIGIISITQSQSGDTITTIYGDIVTETEYFRTSSDHYYLHLVDLPFSIGFNRSLGNSWRIGAEGGVQVNLAFQSSGKILEGSGENSFTALPADGRFRTRLGLSYFAGLTVEKTLTPRTAFYITPRIRFFNNPFSADTYSIKQDYLFTGIHTGFVYTIR